MRELTITIAFTTHALGANKAADGKFRIARTVDQRLIFPRAKLQDRLSLAAELFGKHQDNVKQIHWDMILDAKLVSDCWYKRYYDVVNTKKRRYALHESFVPGQVIGLNCVVPTAIPDDDFWSLMQLVGTYYGLSYWRLSDFGLFEVRSLRQRRNSKVEANVNDIEEQKS